MSEGGSSSGGTVANIGSCCMEVPFLGEQRCQALVKDGGFLPIPPVAERTRGMKEECSTSCKPAAGKPAFSQVHAFCTLPLVPGFY